MGHKWIQIQLPQKTGYWILNKLSQGLKKTNEDDVKRGKMFLGTVRHWMMTFLNSTADRNYTEDQAWDRTGHTHTHTHSKGTAVKFIALISEMTMQLCGLNQQSRACGKKTVAKQKSWNPLSGLFPEETGEPHSLSIWKAVRWKKMCVKNVSFLPILSILIITVIPLLICSKITTTEIISGKKGNKCV